DTQCILQEEDLKTHSNNTRRKSQRQMDKEIKEEAERIRLENQALMRKELLEAGKTPESVVCLPETTTSPPSGRPKRERKVPAHLITGDYESSLLPTLLSSRNVSAGKVGPPKEETDEDNEDEDSGDWNSEDDPERLWCICNQPHNNRFMICCDSCMDWFHGKCVGITKKMGKDMEEASRVWKCPKCTDPPVSSTTVPPQKPTSTTTLTPPPKKQTTPKGKKEEAKRKSYLSQKKYLRTCYVCEKLPRLNSIFCSDDCISKHAQKAKALLQKNRPKASPDKIQVLVMEPKTNTMLNGPNGPTEGILEGWLKSHPTFHVVMPTSLPTSKFYGYLSYKLFNLCLYLIFLLESYRHSSTKKSQQPLRSVVHSTTPSNKVIQISPDGSRLVPVKKSSEEIREAEIKKVQKSLQQHILKESISKKLSQASSAHRGGHSFKPRPKEVLSSKSPPIRKSSPPPPHPPTILSSPPPAPAINPKPIRANVVKGFYEALSQRLSKVTDVQLKGDDLQVLVEEIEESLFRFYNKDVSSKYKAKYRSLVFNIKDEKNTGFFRKIVSRQISTKDLVALTPEDMANKELQRWRQNELKNDIEKIKSHELDMIQLGSKFVMKSHKGEIAIEGEEAAGATSSSSAANNPPLKLPEEINVSDIIISSSRKKDTIEGPKTWDHGTHEFEPTCDVCNGKKTLDEFLTIKIAKEQKEGKIRGEISKNSKSSSSSKHSTSSSRDRDRKRSHSKDKKHSSSSSSKHKEHKRSRSRDSKRSFKDTSKHSSKSEPRSSHSSKHSRRDDERDSSRSHKSSSKSHKSKSSHDSSKSTSHNEARKKSLEEIWSSKHSGSETNKKLKKPKKTIENAIKSTTISSDPPQLSDQPNPPSDAVVSSTVTIKTPESVSTENCPIVWKGDLNMPDVAKFSVTAHQVSGTTDYLTMDLKPLLKIVGRIDPASVWEYIAKMKESPNKEVLLIRLEPMTEDEKAPYLSFFNYLQNRNRFGVVGDSTGKSVKDCYILPLGATQTVHNCMLPFEGPGLEFLKSDMLLALIVRGKRKKAQDYPVVPPSYGQHSKIQKVKILDDIPSTFEEPPDIKASGEIVSFLPQICMTIIFLIGDLKSEIPLPIYDPIKAPTSDDNEIYDPEIAFPDEPKRRKTDDPKFSDEEDSEAPNALHPLTSSGGGFTAKLAQLTAEIEMQKQEINSIEKNIKKPEVSRDPRQQKLSNMTDEDLMLRPKKCWISRAHHPLRATYTSQCSSNDGPSSVSTASTPS
ncbi:AGAP004866PAlike, partial [Caligus rogercresseyi]